MRRLVLVGALVAVALTLMGASVAWGNSLNVYCSASNGPCDESGDWQYNAVLLTWEASPVPTQVAGCDSTRYTDVETTVSCQVWWGSSSQSISFPLNVETSTPVITVAPSRSPDSNGWFNHTVGASVSVASSFSGIASCRSTTYAGAATTTATVGATCLDNAGKTVSAVSAPFAYDATPPTLAATATAAPESVALSWQITDIAPLAAVDVVRTAGGDPQTVYSGTSSGYDDTEVTAGTPYTYTVTARDVAGNASVQTVVATPQTPVVTPATSTRVNSAPLLSWPATRHATYYNVQLYRGNTKVMSVWPSNARLQLRQTWRFDRRRYTLKPGRYKWYVWPGFGKRTWGQYGRMVHSGTFVVVR